MDQIEKIEQSLLDIEEKIEKLPKAHQGITQEHFDLWNERRVLKRSLSLENGEETAIPIEWEHTWCTGAPIPHVVSDGSRVFLAYYMPLNDPKWDGTYVTVRDAKSEKVERIALVEFNHVVNYKFGGPNDEVIHGHPLYEHGLEAYQAHEIINSKWIAEQEQINAVHSCYNPERWKKLKHYVLTFHDEMFECIAEDYKIEIYEGQLQEVVFDATKRLFE